MTVPAGNLRAAQANLNRRLKSASSGVSVLNGAVGEFQFRLDQIEFAHSSAAAAIANLEQQVAILMAQVSIASATATVSLEPEPIPEPIPEQP